jgi:hypothetical protein
MKEKSVEDLNKVKAKIRSLFKLAKDITTNPNEAENANRLARQLMAKHNLTKLDVYDSPKQGPTNVGKTRIEIDYEDLEILLKQQQHLLDLLSLYERTINADERSIKALKSNVESLVGSNSILRSMLDSTDDQLNKNTKKLNSTKFNFFITLIITVCIIMWEIGLHFSR